MFTTKKQLNSWLDRAACAIAMQGLTCDKNLGSYPSIIESEHDNS